jgi:hypothetical protein
MLALAKVLLSSAAILFCAVDAAGAQTATIANPNPPAALAPGRQFDRYPARAKAQPTITGVPQVISWGDEITVTGTNFIGPEAELYAPVPGSASSVLHYRLTPYKVTSESFKLLISRNIVGATNPTMRLRVTTAYGSDTTDAPLRLSLDPRVDRIVTGGAWRQVGTPQQWWQRVIWVEGRNLYGYESASVGSTYVPVTDVWTNDANGVGIQINVPRNCSGQGMVTINFAATRQPAAGPLNAGQVTCLANDQISVP